MSETKKETLADLKPGESAVVATVGGADALHRRLLDGCYCKKPRLWAIRWRFTCAATRLPCGWRMPATSAFAKAEA